MYHTISVFAVCKYCVFELCLCKFVYNWMLYDVKSTPACFQPYLNLFDCLQIIDRHVANTLLVRVVLCCVYYRIICYTWCIYINMHYRYLRDTDWLVSYLILSNSFMCDVHYAVLVWWVRQIIYILYFSLLIFAIYIMMSCVILLSSVYRRVLCASFIYRAILIDLSLMTYFCHNACSRICCMTD
jgi:hypothetical protein